MHSHHAAIANGHMIEELLTLTSLGWENGWCATPSVIGIDKALSLGASVGLGVLAWAATTAAALTIYKRFRRKHRLRTRLLQFQARDETAV